MSRLSNFVQSNPEQSTSKALKDWYKVTWDEEQIHLDVRPPGGEAWTEDIAFADIERVCLMAEDFLISDGIYLFTNKRPESWVVPTEAGSGSDFLFELARRELFTYELIIEASGATSQLFCWPLHEVG